MIAEQKQVYTADEFEAIADAADADDRLLELIDGETIEKMPSEAHGLVQSNFVLVFKPFVRKHKLGRVTTEPRHRTKNDNRNVRLPDVAFTSTERKLPLTTKGSVPQMPDLIVEIQSPDDSMASLRRKAAYYLANGVKIVILAYPSKRLLEVYRDNGDIDILRETDTLEGYDVLPGFTIPVHELFEDD
ncbi:MAG: Uma2 family endonuclease [Chloroflexota bacterium]|nr:Uma2 family endonuclease [Chloroflexota bacterium]